MSNAPGKDTPAYIYVEMTIRDPEHFRQYTALSAPAVHAAGGRYVVAGSKPEVVEGTFDAHRIVVVQFPSVERAREFYHAAAYQAAKEKRAGAAEFKMLLLEGAA